jgi:hypothetical protein
MEAPRCARFERKRSCIYFKARTPIPQFFQQAAGSPWRFLRDLKSISGFIEFRQGTVI